MISVSIQLWLAAGVLMGSAFFSLGVFLERNRMKQIKARKGRARLTMPERICGVWVYNDGKGRAHHCVLDHDHNGDLHRSETGMGRKVSA